MISRPHWSYSAINQYLRCPLQFYFERILGMPQKTIGSALVLGSSVHRTLEAYHRSLQQNARLDVNQARAIFSDSWKDRERQREVAYRNGESRQDCIDLGISLIELYLNEPPPPDIVAVERQVIVPLHNSQGEYLETPLVAVMDLISREESGLKVTEFKTAGRAYGSFEADTSMQPTCYQYAVQEVYGEPASVEFTVFVKTKTPKVQHVPLVRDEDDFGRLGDIVESVEKGIAAEAFFPIETAMNCSTCAYREQCRQWGRPNLLSIDSLQPARQREAIPC